MTAPLLIALPGSEGLAPPICDRLGAELGQVEHRPFPDGETYLKYLTKVSERVVTLLCTLDHPDQKFLPLMFAAAAARDLGAREVGLICPYLAYMRQDKQFQPGEAVTSTYFADLLSGQIDWLVTVDPHLHRRAGLDEIYRVPTQVGHAAPLISEWIRREVRSPLLIGPDSESAQWVAAVAQAAKAPYVILEKVRRGDRDVQVSVPEIERWRDHTPVLVDDIISTARTMIETVSHLKAVEMTAPVCIAVHGIFAGNALRDLVAAGASRVVTCNTIPHQTNAIDVTPLLAQGVRAITGRTG